MRWRMKMSSKSHPFKDKEINDLKTYLQKIEVPVENISKDIDIEELSSQISKKYEKTISPGQVEAILHRVMGITLTAKQRTQLYDLRKKIQRYEKFLANFREWGKKYDNQLKMIILGLTEEQSDYLSQVLTKPFIAPDRNIIGVNFMTKSIESFGKFLPQLQIWDITNQERFAFIRPQFYRGAAAAFLVFNKESRSSFNTVKNYSNEVREETGLKFKLKIKHKTQKEISLPIGLIATGRNNVIPYEEILSLTKDIGASYYELETIEDERFQEILIGTAMAVLVRLQNSS
ncbi:MAG: hypothetical protein EAX91_12175 [Candidatus Lokiarchaeota archaeon]|nr:hypothetical protein [Candidatus Lokiarchaeota archaeon]